MEQTSMLKLPLLLGSQAQKHVTHNEALTRLDRLVHLAVIDAGRTEAPLTPATDDLHIVAGGATGDWAGKDGKLAWYTGGTWVYLEPQEGWRAWVLETATLYVYSGGAWVAALSAGSSGVLGVNTEADSVNRLSVKSDGVLFSHDDQTPGTGDVNLQINRATSARQAKIQLSTAWLPQAEMGIAGDDTFRIKVSADGSSFSPGLALNTATGNIGLGSEPGNDRITVRQDQPGNTQFSLANRDTGAGSSSSLWLDAGASQYFGLQLYGTGILYAYSNASMVIGTYADNPLALRTDTTDRLVVHGDGRISINEASPSAQVSVNGALRVGSFAKAALPSPAGNGAGALIFVPDATGGAVTAFSDGSSWRRTTDRSVIS